MNYYVSIYFLKDKDDIMVTGFAVLQFFRNEDGLTVVEYVVAAALLVSVVTLVFITLQTGLSDKFSSTISSAGN
ncbi:hypothetical protein BCT94_15635 [Vibrio breoganii]|nr:hypothetical protein BCV08_18435 [Vibrio breoganii]PMG99808.1 hypothetical protein BCU80_02805 [Vibrio breoganii]PMH12750.1 hypothetical protein BCU74_17040 [Vibrio breoganii]PMK52918.1 hypothetical protein BCT98_02110 [Vibrio breoganii]PMK69346.1 hypothetical protein BCT94_15635 [Vibrio breoganii]